MGAAGQNAARGTNRTRCRWRGSGGRPSLRSTVLIDCPTQSRCSAAHRRTALPAAPSSGVNGGVTEQVPGECDPASNGVCVIRCTHNWSAARVSAPCVKRCNPSWSQLQQCKVTWHIVEMLCSCPTSGIWKVQIKLPRWRC
jgi:hypothetical protein